MKNVLLLSLLSMALTGNVMLAEDHGRSKDRNHHSCDCKNPTWVTTLGATPNIMEEIGATLQLNDQTVRMIVHVSVGGTQIRLRLSNEVGTDTLVISQTSVGIVSSGANIISGTNRAVTFSGNSSVTIKLGDVVLSDPIALEVPNEADLAISMYTDSTSLGVATSHYSSLQTSYVSKTTGNFTQDITGQNFDPILVPCLFGLWQQGSPLYYVSAVEILPKDACKCSPISTIVILGDSIADGTATTLSANYRIGNFLAKRLLENKLPHAVATEALGGNRATIPSNLGPAAVARLNRDALSVTGRKHIIVMVGENDINNGVPPAEIINAYLQIITRLKVDPNIKVYGCTITPFIFSGFSQNRHIVNDWIRNSGAFDAVFDFDRLLADPQNPDALAPQYVTSDPIQLHPNDLGHQTMANSIDLGLFRECCKEKCHYTTLDEIHGTQPPPCSTQEMLSEEEAVRIYKEFTGIKS